MHPQPAKAVHHQIPRRFFFHKKSLNPHNNCVFKLIHIQATGNDPCIPDSILHFFSKRPSGSRSQFNNLKYKQWVQYTHKLTNVHTNITCARQSKQLRFGLAKPISANNAYYTEKRTQNNNTYKITQHRCHLLTKVVVRNKILSKNA